MSPLKHGGVWLAYWRPDAPQNRAESFNFAKVLPMLNEARTRCVALLAQRSQADAGKGGHSSWFGLSDVFDRPPETMTYEALVSLRERIEHLASLISEENRTGHFGNEQRLAIFVGLDEHQLNYDQKLKELILNSPQPDPLIDNIELALAQLETDSDQKILRLTELVEHYQGRDGRRRSHATTGTGTTGSA